MPYNYRRRLREAVSLLSNDGYQTTLKEGLDIEYNADTRMTDTSGDLAQFEKKKFGR